MVEARKLAPNPFSVTKANDFTDEEIRDFWVDYEDEGGFLSLFAPQEAMPKLLLGGKGSGKTHLMRYYSFPLQLLRATGENILEKIQSDGYVGIYTRCGGLDSSRFSGKGQNAETWGVIFAYYTDLWLSYHMVDVAEKLIFGLPQRTEQESAACGSIMALFDRSRTAPPSTFSELKRLLRELQREVDHAVNNAAITRTLDLKVSVTPGRLVFGVPREVAAHFEALSSLNFIYLIDELELLTENQQRFINTLVRDRAPPVTFRLGARTYGIRTHITLAAQEENRPGSEFDQISLDEHLRQGKKRYDSFARRVISNRLRRAGIVPFDDSQLDEFFASPPQSKYRREETAFVQAKTGERRYFKRLRQQLADGHTRGILKGVEASATIDRIIDLLRVPDTPLLEKLNILLLYRAIAGRRDLLSGARDISKACEALINGRAQQAKKYRAEFQHFSFDLYAQLCREYDQPVRYLGLAEFIRLSDGLPRSLLIILKSIYKWADFSGERPFHAGQISLRAQERGVLEASDWFYREAPRGGGEEAVAVSTGVARLAELFRELLHSDKPPECSLITFAADLGSASALAQARLDTAEKFSLLVRITKGQKDKNTGRVDEKFQLNRMLTPRWQLPLSRRGTITLNASELAGIFCSEDDKQFQEAKSKRLIRSRFPFGLTGSKETRSIPLFSEPEDD